jgi:hypothetical protein
MVARMLFRYLLLVEHLLSRLLDFSTLFALVVAAVVVVFVVTVAAAEVVQEAFST